MSGDFLLEVRTEEIPARMLPGATRELATRLFEELMARGIPPGEIETGFTPRRLWLVMKRLPAKEADSTTVELGPPADVAFDAQGKPTAAAIGFARKFGVEVSALRRRVFSREETLHAGTVSGEATKRAVKAKAEGDRVYLELEYEGRATLTILAELLPAVLRSLTWAKTMRWGAGVGPWVRPVHGVVALLDAEVVPFRLFDVESGRTTAGHSTLSPAPFAVSGVGDWREKLASLDIVPEPGARERRLREAMTERAAATGGTLVDDPELFAKLAAICEIPGVLEGSFDGALLELPREVLITSLRDHQSALTVEREGSLLPLFLTVMDRADDPAGRVRAGNEWVVAARLADARFFWQKDRARPLAECAAELSSLAFHERLGSYADKTGRVVDLVRRLAAEGELPAAEAGAAERAATFAKADLATEMVREFTSLQGVMGGIYLREEGEPEAVWQAVYDQYRPAGADDALPRGAAGRVLAIADRIDTLVGFFVLGPKFRPSGSKDPFGLRRTATGVVRLALENAPALDLPRALGAALEAYTPMLTREQRGDKPRPVASGDETLAALSDFLWDRAEHLLGLAGLAYDEIDAARGATGRTAALDFGAALACARAIAAVRTESSFLAVVLAAKRIANITRDQPSHRLDVAALELPAERELAAAGEAFAAALADARERSDHGAGLAAVARLAPALERFFTDVLVMDPDAGKRAQRLALLQSIGAEIARLADLSRLVVDKAELRAADSS